jgi:hypothetical protein
MVVRPADMEIAFRTKVLRTACLSKDAMDERYGAERAEYLRGRMADMRAADVLQNVPLIDPRPVEGTFGTEISVDIGRGLNVVLRVNHTNPPTLPDGNVDWSRVERVLVQRIECING